MITLFIGKWVAYVPFATLAAILTVVAYHMSEWRAFRGEFTSPRSDLIVMLTTFLLTVIIDLTIAIQVGMVLAAFLFMKRMSDVASVQALTSMGSPDEPVTGTHGRLQREIPDGVEIFEISGPFFFGAAKSFQAQVESVLGRPRVLILRMKAVPAIDSTGLHTLVDVVRRARKENTRVLLCDVHSQPRAALDRSHLLNEIGEASIRETLDDAIDYARSSLAGK
jgi:SulP family sulfate permease